MSKRSTKGPIVPESRDFLWQALRQMRTATARELAAITERPKNSVQVDLRYLVHTGYVRMSDGEVPTYTLIRDTGVRPPQFIMDGNDLTGAVDRNTHKHFGIDGNPPPAKVGRQGRFTCKGRAPKGEERPPRRARVPYWNRRKGRGGAP